MKRCAKGWAAPVLWELVEVSETFGTRMRVSRGLPGQMVDGASRKAAGEGSAGWRGKFQKSLWNTVHMMIFLREQEQPQTSRWMLISLVLAFLYASEHW